MILKCFQIGNFLVMNLLPFLVLTFCNISIYRIVTRYAFWAFLQFEHFSPRNPSSQYIRSRMRSHRRDLTMSVLLITIVMVFILCNTVRVMCNVYEATQVSDGVRSTNSEMCSRCTRMGPSSSGQNGLTSSQGSIISSLQSTAPSTSSYTRPR